MIILPILLFNLYNFFFFSFNNITIFIDDNVGIEIKGVWF